MQPVLSGRHTPRALILLVAGLGRHGRHGAAAAAAQELALGVQPVQEDLPAWYPRSAARRHELLCVGHCCHNAVVKQARSWQATMWFIRFGLRTCLLHLLV